MRGGVVGVRIHIDCGFKADAQTLQALVGGQEVAAREDVDERVALQTAQPAGTYTCDAAVTLTIRVRGVTCIGLHVCCKTNELLMFGKI